MLNGSNDKVLINRGVKAVIVPFYQRWQELMHKKTLDIYQYKIMTSLSAMKELVLVIKKTKEGLFTSDANIEACRKELLYILNRDRVMEMYHKAILNSLRHVLGKVPKAEAEKNRLLYRLQYAINQIEQVYLKEAIDELKQAILKCDIEGVEAYSDIVASQAIYNGWSSTALKELLRFFTIGDMRDKEFEEQWNAFRNQLLVVAKTKYHVLINVPFKPRQREEQENLLEVMQRVGLEVKKYAELCTEFADIEDIGRLLNADKRYFRVLVEAYDVYTAAHLAIMSVSEQLNMASFYNMVSAWDLSSVVILAINENTRYHSSFTAENLYQTYDYMDSSGRVFEYTQRIFVDENRKTVREKLKGSFGYTNISRVSLFQEEKYMNLWVALESLARTDMYTDIISCVKDTVPAAVCMRYIYRIVRNYVEDCSRCGIHFDFAEKSIDMHQESKRKMVCETIEVFQNQKLYAELSEKCRVNTLLKYRTESIHEVLTNINKSKEKIERHYDRISWQIQRLYRIRNEIAHAALQDQNLLITYVEHLYDYLSTYTSEIITSMVENGQKRIEEALCSIKDNYDVFIMYAVNNESDILTNSVLKTGVIGFNNV